MRYKLNRDVKIRETGLVIQPNLYWVAASQDGMVNLGEQPGLENDPSPGVEEHNLRRA